MSWSSGDLHAALCLDITRAAELDTVCPTPRSAATKTADSVDMAAPMLEARAA